jgi:TusE/DsrC/DsvC family sulfur relay protein
MTTDLTQLTARLDEMTSQLAYLTERQLRQEEMFAELTPLARVALNAATERLATLEQEGYFELAKELAQVVRQVSAGFTVQDVRELGGSIVAILDAVRALTQPAMLAMVTDAAAALNRADDVKPIGIFGMVKATRNDDVQKGMALMVEVLRRVGHAATVASARHREIDGKRVRLAEMLGSRKKKIFGIERNRMLGDGNSAIAAAAPATLFNPRSQATATGQAAPAASTPRVQPAPRRPVASSVGATVVGGTVIDGVAFNPDGHLADAASWSRELAIVIAQLQGIDLTDPHWQLIEAARADFAASGTSPNIRRLTEVAQVTTKDIYRLFPKAPGRMLAKIAGLPRPAGCL